MVTPHVPTLGRPPRAAPKHLGAVLAGVALALLVAVGAIVWQATRNEQEAAPVAPNVAAVPAAPVGATAVPGSTLFVVGADEEAGLLAAELEALGADQYVRVERIQVVATDLQFAELMLAIVERNLMREANGLPPVAVVDRRPAATAVTPMVVSGPQGAGSHPEWYPGAPPAVEPPAFTP